MAVKEKCFCGDPAELYGMCSRHLEQSEREYVGDYSTPEDTPCLPDSPMDFHQ